MAKIKRDLTIFCNIISAFRRDADLLSVSADQVDVMELVKDITWECSLPELLKIQKLLNKRIEQQLKQRDKLDRIEHKGE